MGSDLKHTICGSIYDQFTGAHMLVPVIRNDLCAGVRLIAQHISAGADPELFQHILGEAVRIGRQWLGRIDTCDLPVPDGRILSAGTLRHAGVSCGGMVCFLSHFLAVNIKQTHVFHIFHMKKRAL